MDQFQHMTLVFQFCRPVWQRWFETAVLAGVLPVGIREFGRNRPLFQDAKWIPPKWDWVDPLKDRQAEKLAVDELWKPRSDVIEGEGFDPEEVDARIAADQKREASLDLKRASASGSQSRDDGTADRLSDLERKTQSAA
jgi:capsid protein